MAEAQLLSSRLRSERERKPITLFESMPHSPEDTPAALLPGGFTAFRWHQTGYSAFTTWAFWETPDQNYKELARKAVIHRKERGRGF